VSIEVTAKTLEAPRAIICNDASSRCEDCPVINPTPPSESDCPNFDLLGGEPFCNKEDMTRRQIDGGGISTGIGSIACPGFVELLG
jgi:hypothetical protein